MSPAVSACAIPGIPETTPQLRRATNRTIHAAASHSASLRTNVVWWSSRRSVSRPQAPPPGQRHFLATSHPWPCFAAPRHGLTTIRHIPVPEIRASWSPVVSGPETTLTAEPPWTDQGLPQKLGGGPILRPVYPAGTSLRQTTPARPSVAGQSIDLTNTPLRA